MVKFLFPLFYFGSVFSVMVGIILSDVLMFMLFEPLSWKIGFDLSNLEFPLAIFLLITFGSLVFWKASSPFFENKKISFDWLILEHFFRCFLCYLTVLLLPGVIPFEGGWDQWSKVFLMVTSGWAIIINITFLMYQRLKSPFKPAEVVRG